MNASCLDREVATVVCGRTDRPERTRPAAERGHGANSCLRDVRQHTHRAHPATHPQTTAAESRPRPLTTVIAAKKEEEEEDHNDGPPAVSRWFTTTGSTAPNCWDPPPPPTRLAADANARCRCELMLEPIERPMMIDRAAAGGTWRAIEARARSCHSLRFVVSSRDLGRASADGGGGSPFSSSSSSSIELQRSEAATAGGARAGGRRTFVLSFVRSFVVCGCVL